MTTIYELSDDVPATPATDASDVDLSDADGSDADAFDMDDAPRREPFSRVVPWLLTAGGAFGLFSALDLNIERTKLLEDPDYVATCSINPVVDCGVVATSAQASIFGFSNTLFGVVGFSVALTLGMLLLLGGRAPRAVWVGLNIGLAFGVGFVHWLISQSVYSIGVLCPYCMVVWSVTIPMFWYVTIRNLTTGVFGASVARSSVVRTLASVHVVPVVLWFVIVIALIAIQFADNWVALLS